MNGTNTEQQMKPTVAVIAPGNMGAAVGARLVQQGLEVLTSLEGRSAASAERAAAAGMRPVADAEIAQADFLLSIVPPGQALPLAERLSPALDAGNHKPLYVECNAVSPATVRRIAEVVAETGCPFADAGIIGPPPKVGDAGPRFYVSGREARQVEALGGYGLDVRAMDGEAGDASALKMSYGGLTKGLTALGSALVLGAHRAGVSDALHAELAASQPALLAYLTRSVPAMFSKAYRWVAEMEEIASFLGEDAERDMYEGTAALYERLASDFDGSKTEIDTLAKFFQQGRAAQSN
jgi:3-hydroxyisobutyrate dehydrogenase-like beta-hydroxyacid dehydrogenase